MRRVWYFLFLIVVMACGSKERAANQLLLRVNSHTVPCTGEAEGECLLVQEGEAIGTDDWQYFYFKDDIQGFQYEEGYIYDLVVAKETVQNPAMDSSSIIYKLVRIKSKEKE